MSRSHPRTTRSSKFTDAFERSLANDLDYHLGRDEPSTLWPALQRLSQRIAAFLTRASVAPR